MQSLRVLTFPLSFREIGKKSEFDGGIPVEQVRGIKFYVFKKLVKLKVRHLFCWFL